MHPYLASDDGLDEEAKVGEHGKTAVLDLLYLQDPANYYIPAAYDLTSPLQFP